MDRVSSVMIPSAALNDLARAQRTLVETARQSSAQTKADDLKGYGREAQTIISAGRVAGRIEGFIKSTEELRTRMELQDAALSRASSAISKLREDLFQNIGLQNGDGVPASIEEAFAVVKDSLNMTLNGRFVFGGVANDQAPVATDTLADLIATPLANAVVPSPGLQQVRIEESRIVPAGPLASDIADTVLGPLKRLAETNAGPDGPFGGPLTTAQRAALDGELGALEAAFNTFVLAQSQNGRSLKSVEEAGARQQQQLDALNAAVGDITNVDLAEVAVRLNQAQFAYEASASIFNTLRSLSLLNVLR
ncbi:hypothetical protein GC169_02500 [bacterium]|nr:hypothetical protein [bacterium]